MPQLVSSGYVRLGHEPEGLGSELIWENSVLLRIEPSMATMYSVLSF